MITLIVVSLTTVIMSIVWYYRIVGRYPPGPAPVPFLGNLLQLSPDNTHKQIEKLGAKFGPVYTVFIPLPTVIISGYEEHKEALLEKAENFSSRPNNPSDSMFMNSPNGGIIFAEGPRWAQQKQFTLAVLRQLGVGSQLMETKILSSTEKLFEFLQIQDLSQMDLNWPVHLCVANIVHEILFGFQVPFDDCEEMLGFQKRIDDAMHIVRSRVTVLLVQALPWTRFLPFIGRWGYWDLREIAIELQDYVQLQIDKAIETLREEGETHNYTHAYLQELRRRERANNLESFSMDQLGNCLLDLWLAGMETAATTVRWALTLLTVHPDVQEKLYEEMRDVLGDEPLSMSHKTRLPYVQAVICEIHRVSNVVTFNVFHKTYKDDTISGKFIPAGSTVLPQITSVLSSSEVFENAEKFDPERFIERTDDGIKLKKEEMEKVIAFSLGKRRCAGEALARMEVFLIPLSIIRRYRIEPSDQVCPSLEPVFGILQTPRPYTSKLTLRQSQ